MLQVSRTSRRPRSLENLVRSENNRRIHIDLSADVFEVVKFVGLIPERLIATSCTWVRDCTDKEIKLLKAALADGRIDRRPCKVGEKTFQIAVMG